MTATTLRKQFTPELVVCRLLEGGKIRQQNYYPVAGRVGDELQAGWYTNHDLTVERHIQEGWQKVYEFV